MPTGLDSKRQQEHLLLLAEYAEHMVGEPLVIVGDLNMVAESPAYARLAKTFTDAHVAAGSGLGFTFPQDLTIGDQCIPGPFVRLDFVFYNTALTALTSQVRCLPGSDHCLVMTELMVD